MLLSLAIKINFDSSVSVTLLLWMGESHWESAAI